MLSECMGVIGVFTSIMAGLGDRPCGNPHVGRSVVMATSGMVATSHPLAAQAGIDMLKQGGSAVDAAIAANAVLGVAEPMSCGIGGDLFAIVWDAKTQKLYGLNASGRSPHAATVEFFREKGLDAVPTRGPLSWSVPGCVDGWETLRVRFGRLELSTILAPAIGYAHQGFPVTEIIAQDWRLAEDLLNSSPDAARTYLRNGKAPACGQRMTNSDIAQTYARIASAGARDFYQGQIARKIVGFSESNGGLFTMRDLADHTSTWVDPVSTNYRGYDVWELPPNGQGISVLQILNLLEPYDIKAMGHNSPEFLHLFLEAKKLVYEDRARFYADPQVAEDLPIAELISKQYAELRGKLIDPHRASTDVTHGDPRLAHSDTVYITVVDKDRNAVSLIQSIYFGWGSGLVPGDLGFALQNRGTMFHLDPEHPNCMAPHKRPFHTIIPAMVTRKGKPWLCFGVMGGEMQPQGQVQVLCNLIDHGMNIQEAGEAARVQHQGSSTPMGKRMQGGGEVLVESGISDQAVEALTAKGHKVIRGRGGFGGFQGIVIDHDQDVLQGGSESRKDGAAIGY